MNINDFITKWKIMNLRTKGNNASISILYIFKNISIKIGYKRKPKFQIFYITQTEFQWPVLKS
jgi:hypothetical protein